MSWRLFPYIWPVSAGNVRVITFCRWNKKLSCYIFCITTCMRAWHWLCEDPIRCLSQIITSTLTHYPRIYSVTKILLVGSLSEVKRPDFFHKAIYFQFCNRGLQFFRATYKQNMYFKFPFRNIFAHNYPNIAKTVRHEIRGYWGHRAWYDNYVTEKLWQWLC